MKYPSDIILKGYVFFVCGSVHFLRSTRERGREQWFERFFSSIGWRKKTVPKPKILLKPQKSQMEAIFVKNPNWNSFQVFERFFFNPSKKNAVKSDSWREGGEFICTLENETLTPFSISPENLVFFMEPCIACLLVRFLSLLKLHQICSSKPISISRFSFFLIRGEPHRPSLLIGI